VFTIVLAALILTGCESTAGRIPVEVLLAGLPEKEREIDRWERESEHGRNHPAARLLAIHNESQNP
jgi:hypothetical protein